MEKPSFTSVIGKLQVVIMERKVVLNGWQTPRTGGKFSDTLMLTHQDLHVVICEGEREMTMSVLRRLMISSREMSSAGFMETNFHGTSRSKTQGPHPVSCWVYSEKSVGHKGAQQLTGTCCPCPISGPSVMFLSNRTHNSTQVLNILQAHSLQAQLGCRCLMFYLVLISKGVNFAHMVRRDCTAETTISV